ncbi:hypothetical protein C8A00DRAFT_12896 [Chaetomidium leptoderma]|uniref:Rhodopsin domain-containing protein n=1 Tax=Chaetomidium leptoderma TaxID=669021 RepID=A0AAN6ZXX4_9PEZI|nr:hypothetical protein C8A00DRAFT_12896 [Chaetomidium leptoderma]
MRLPPPDVVASWPDPNYINPVTRGPAIIIVELITLPVALICLGLRLYVKVKTIGRSEWDDWMMVGGAFFGIGVTICVVLAFARYGWDIHVWDLTFDDMIAGRQVSFAAQALFIPATSLAKISILTSYLRLAPRNSLFRTMTFAGIWFVVMVNVAFFVVLFTQCIPLSSYWNLFKNRHDCVPEAPALLSQAITTAISDFMVWVLPLPSLFCAKLPLSQRLALIALFSFGSVVVLAACIRTYWIHYVVEETYDVTWYGFHLWMWTAIEVHLGIICGCIPWLKSFFKFWRTQQTIIDITDITDTSRGVYRSRSDGQRGTISKRGTVIRMDDLKKGLNPKREKYATADLETGSAHSNQDTIHGLPATTPGLAF